MNNYKCVLAKYCKQGLKTFIICNATNDYCLCQRYCVAKKDVEHTQNAQYCTKNPNKIDK